MNTRPAPFWRTALAVFAVTLALYAGAFGAIQHWRQRRGPWEVTFRADTSGAPVLEIAQPRLGIAGIQIVFAGTNAAAPASAVTVRFDEPAKANAIPFGRVKFIDTTFLPGTVTFDCFGHEVELLPRTLIIDKVERRWESGARVELPARPLK